MHGTNDRISLDALQPVEITAKAEQLGIRKTGLALANMFVLALLAGLFVWKNTASFVPPYDEDMVETLNDAVAGRDSAAGFVNLLRRSISSAEVLSVCFAEWKKARAHGRAELNARTERMAAIIAEEQAKSERERNPVESYRRITSILSERK